MNIYENITILNATLSDEEIESAKNRITELIVSSGGEVLTADAWGRKKLAYEIKKQKKGFYILFLFKAPPAFIKKLEDFYKVFDPVIKYMVLRLGKKQIEAALKSVPTEGAAPASEEKAEQKSEA